LAEAAPWLGVVSFAAYAGVEYAVGLWAASLLVESRGLSHQTAGVWVGMYYASITVGRFATGLVSDRVGNRFLVRLGLALATVGGMLLSIRPMSGAALVGLLCLGLGFAPVYPCLVHETPRRFEPELARSVIGFQVGAAYVGGPILPALVGLIAARWGLESVPACIVGLVALVVASTEVLNALTARRA
jgi:fucose permease